MTDKRKQIVVLIDCWDYDKPEPNIKGYENIKDPDWPVCESGKDLQKLPRWIKDECLTIHKMDFWIYHDLTVNIKNNLRQHAFSNIKKFIANNHVDLIVDATYGNRPIHPTLTSVVNSKKCIKILERRDFENKVLSSNEPLDIYYMGMHWNMCIKNRPVGWKNVLPVIKRKAVDCRIFFDPDTIVKMSWSDCIECPTDFNNSGDLENLMLNNSIKSDRPIWQLRPNATI